MKKIKNKVIKVGKKIDYNIKLLIDNCRLLKGKAKRKIFGANQSTINNKQLAIILQRFFKHHWKKVGIGFATLILLSGLGFGVYKYLTTPRAPNLKEAKGGYLYSANGLNFTAYIGNRENNRPEVNFAVGTGSVVFTPASGNENPTKPKEDGKKAIIFKDVYNGVDFKYQTTPLGIKEDIVINKPTIIKTFPFYLDFKDVTPQYLTENIKGTTFFDKDEKYLFNFEKPYAVDAKGARNDNVGLTIKKDSATGKYVAIISLDDTWMNDSSRSYPVTIDPTIVHDTTAEFATGQFNRLTDTGSGSSPNLMTNYQEFPIDPYTVALWHMNEASGNILDISGNSNTGTPTGTTVTTGMFSNGRSFNGTSEYITVSNSTSISSFSSMTAEAWVNPSSWTSNDWGPMILSKYGGDYKGFVLYLSGTTGKPALQVCTPSTCYTTISTITIPTNSWSHVAGVWDGKKIYIYVNGVLRNYADAPAMTNSTIALKIGMNSWSSLGYFPGKIDEIRISNISRSNEEIRLDASRRPYSTYASSVIDLTSTGSWNSFSWNGLGFATVDGETATASAQSALVAQWNFNETSGTTAVSGGSCSTSCNGTLTNMTTTGQDAAANSGWTANNRRWGAGALMFDGSNDTVNAGNNSAFNMSTAVSIEAWVNTTQGGTNNVGIFDKYTGSTAGYFIDLPSGTTMAPRFDVRTSSDQSVTATIPINDGIWHHIVGTYNGSLCQIYIDGKLNNSAACTGTITNDTHNVYIGGDGVSTNYFKGVIDSPKIYSRALTAAEILSNYNSSHVEFQTRVGNSTDANDGTWEDWKPATGETQINSFDSDSLNWAWDLAATYMPKSKSDESNIKMEGTGSLKLSVGVPQADGSTIALWHLEETGGTGAYLKDASSSANNATPTGTTVVDGFIGKGRSFNGTSSDIINITGNSTFDIPANGNFSGEAWIKTTTDGKAFYVNQLGTDLIYMEVGATTAGGTANKLVVYLRDAGGTLGVFSGTTTITDGKWHYVAFTALTSGSARTVTLYVDGVYDNSGSWGTAGAINHASTIGIGGLGASYYFSGSVDELRISNAARSYSEIAEAYRAGRDHYLNKTISSTNLSSSLKLPFYIASDKLGTFMQITYGESDYANYQPDANTVALWHLNEQSGTGAYVIDATGNGYNGTPNGTVFAQGKIGKGRYFGGSANYISMGNIPSGTSGTVEAWINPSGTYTSPQAPVGGIASNGLSASSLYTIGAINTSLCASGDWFTGIGDGTNYQIACSGQVYNTTNFPAGTWAHLVVTYDGTNIRFYKDGVLVNTVAQTTSAAVSTAQPYAIGRYGGYNGYYYYGLIDEVRISNITRTADEIRQAYEIGSRTHNITIDFKAKLDSGNLIANTSDYGFTINETAYGSSAMANHIFLGDKIVVKENYNGTEYIAQGTVNSVNSATGAITVASWDTGSTVPSGGFTVNATVFKWQREYFDLTGPLASHRDAITRLTYRITDGLSGANIWLDDLRSSTGYLSNPVGSVIASSVGSRYFQYRAILTQNEVAATSSALTSVTLDYVQNSKPATPTLDSPTNAATDQAFSPTLKTTATDSDSDNLQYKIELCTDSGMTQNCQTFNQATSQTGWSGQNGNGNTTYTSGTQASYTLQTSLSIGTTYYWRSYAIDPSGTNTWSGTQGTPYSFTITNAPTAPTSLLTQGQINPTGLPTSTPYFSAIHHDPDSDDANYYQILVNTASNFSGTSMWDSGKVSMATTASGGKSPDITYGGSSLSWGGTYYWKIKFWDTFGAEGVYSSAAQFTLNSIPMTPTLDSPTNAATDQAFSPTLKTTATDSDSDNLQYKIELCTDSGMTQNCQTFNQATSQTGWSGQNGNGNTTYTSGTQASYTLQTSLSIGTTYYWRSYAIDPSGTNTWSGTQIPNSFATLNAPAAASNCRIQEDYKDSKLTVIWTDNASNENNYEIQRSVDGGNFSVLQTSMAANTVSYDDTSITEGHTYQYRIAPYFTTGPSYSSWCTTSKLSLQLGTFSIKGLNLKGLILH